MSALLWIQVAFSGIIVAALSVTVFFLRRTAKLDRITAKLRAGEPLTDRERHLLDRVR